MAILSDIKIKNVTAASAITTDGVPGILLHVLFCGATAGDRLEILDGTTQRVNLLIPANNGSIEYNPPIGQEPRFTTDIDAGVTAASKGYATFIYREIT